MSESNKMKEMPVNRLMVQMGIPMILSMALQAVYNIVDSAFVGNMKVGSEAALNALTLVFPVQHAYGGSRNWNRCRNQCASRKDTRTGKCKKSCKSGGQQFISRSNYLCGMFLIWNFWSKSIHFITDH